MQVSQSILTTVFRLVFTTALASMTGCNWLNGTDEETDEGPSDTGDEPADTADSEEDTGDSESEQDTGYEGHTGDIYPDNEWATDDPEAHGFDADKLEEAAGIAEDQDSHCLMVVHGGVVIGEWYFDNWDQDNEQNVFSITKSVTSAAMGIASDMGLLDVTDPASDYITDWKNTESEDVTIAQLLSNTSGRYWELINDYLNLDSADDKTEFAIELDQAETPDTVWEYNNSAVQTLERVMTEATGEELDDFATEHLLSKLGMASTFSRDEAGNTIAFSDLSASCADLARFAYLILRNGKWKGEQLISEEYLDKALSPSSELNTAYGYLFWLNRDGHWVEPSALNGKPEDDGKHYESLPENMVYAEGLQDQLAVVFPDDDLVVTRIGGQSDAISAALSGSTHDAGFVEDLLATILEARN